jgi:hypothetical protein
MIDTWETDTSALMRPECFGIDLVSRQNNTSLVHSVNGAGKTSLENRISLVDGLWFIWPKACKLNTNNY